MFPSSIFCLDNNPKGSIIFPTDYATSIAVLEVDVTSKRANLRDRIVFQTETGRMVKLIVGLGDCLSVWVIVCRFG